MTTSESFRDYLFAHDHPRLAEVRGLDAYAYRDVAHTPGSFTGGLVEGWRPLYRNDFVGITEDGTLHDGLYPLAPAEPGESAPVAAMITAAQHLLVQLDDEALAKINHAVDAVEWQTWANPEFLQFDTGLRLEFQPAAVQQAVLELMRASLSPAGFEIAHRMMQINGFLGEVVDLPTILNEFSYNVALYGAPHPSDPWGWQLYGHHCAVSCLVVAGRMVLSPVFLGAEPDHIDEGPLAGGGHFDERIRRALAIMSELTPEQRDLAIAYDQLVDPAMPEGRVHPGDERHLAGAFQDNRVIPYEGVPVDTVSEDARRAVLAFCEEFVSLLPEGPRRARLREIEEHLDDTWVTWMGGWQPGEVFYVRVQSPVVIAELDHHCGVFLDYDTPKSFHIHTVLRTPHGNDYGRSWVRQWQTRQGPRQPDQHGD